MLSYPLLLPGLWCGVVNRACRRLQASTRTRIRAPRSAGQSSHCRPHRRIDCRIAVGWTPPCTSRWDTSTWWRLRDESWESWIGKSSFLVWTSSPNTYSAQSWATSAWCGRSRRQTRVNRQSQSAWAAPSAASSPRRDSALSASPDCWLLKKASSRRQMVVNNKVHQTKNHSAYADFAWEDRENTSERCASQFQRAPTKVRLWRTVGHLVLRNVSK